MRENTLHQIMYLRIASNTQKIQSSDWPKCLCELWRYVQGGHAVWKSGKTGKMAKTNSLQGKIREFQNLKKKIRELSGNFTIVKKRNVSTGSFSSWNLSNCFISSNCKQYAFYCSLNNWVNIWCIWHSIPCSTKLYGLWNMFCRNYVLMMVIKTEL